MNDVIIIGAGMAGIAAARRLTAAGIAPIILDKGRGIGGRMATRRVRLDTGEIQFDHGAQYMTARDPGFTRALEAVRDDVALWSDGASHPHHVGIPGMSGLARSLARGLDLRQKVSVTGLHQAEGRWTVKTDNGSMDAHRVVVTVPAPQLASMLGADHPFVTAAKPVHIAPCLTLMAAFPAGSPRPFISRADPENPLAWIAEDSSKPGRPGIAKTWVAQASPDWSVAHLEKDADEIATLMLPLLCAEIGAAPTDALYAAAHRWRYARVTTALGAPFLKSACGTLHAGGDWCLGAKLEAAWQSGDAIARDVSG